MVDDEDDIIQPRINSNAYTVYFTDSYDKANDILRQHEEHNDIKYACWHQSKDFGRSGLFHFYYYLMFLFVDDIQFS